MITLKIGAQEEEFEFLVDKAAERTCVCKIPKGCEKSRNTIQVRGAKGEGFKAPVIKYVIFEGTNKIGMEDVLFVSEAGCNMLGRDLQAQLSIGVLPERDKMVAKLLWLKEDERQIKEVI